MVAIKVDEQHAILCDSCGEVSVNKYDTFQEALSAVSSIGWGMRHEDGRWLGMCPTCKEAHNLKHQVREEEILNFA